MVFLLSWVCGENTTDSRIGLLESEKTPRRRFMTKTRSRTEPSGVDDLTAIVGRRVTELRAIAGVTQQNISTGMRLLGIEWSRMTVADVERGKRKVSLEELAALAALFSVPALDLLLPTGEERIALGDRSLTGETVRELFLGGGGEIGVGGPDWSTPWEALETSGPSVLAETLWTNLERIRRAPYTTTERSEAKQ
jgi:transcriptional regulator with XRE-family HTH domain